MLKLINEDLMSFETAEITDKKSGKTYHKLKVVTSNKIQQYENRFTSKDRTAYLASHTYSVSNTNETNKVENRAEKLLPLNREILRVAAPLAAIKETLDSKSNNIHELRFDLPMSLNISYFQSHPNVEIRCHEDGEDRANVYVVAFPFNGMIKPIPKSEQYRVYKGMLASSARPFCHFTRKYRKALYLIIEPNKKLFNPSNKYHTDKIEIPLESFSLFTDRETGETKTKHEKMTLTITSAEGDHTVKWEYETINSEVYVNTKDGESLWTIYQFQPREDKRTSSGDTKSFTRAQDNTQSKYSVNAHGIRRENTRGGKPMNTGKDDLDDMMQGSGMYGKKNSRGKRNGGKKNKNRGNDY